MSGSVLHLHRSLIVLAGFAAARGGRPPILRWRASRHEPLRWRKIVDSGSEPAHRIRADRRRLRRSAVRRRGVVRAAAAAGRDRLRRVRRMCFSLRSPRASSATSRAAWACSNRCYCCCSGRCPPMSCSAALLAYRIIYYLVPVRRRADAARRARDYGRTADADGADRRSWGAPG